MLNLHQDFKEFLRLLNFHRVEYLLVGGYAVSFHGYPRYTGDMDVWVAVADENAEKIVLALREFGFDSPDLSKEMFLDAKRMTRLGREPVQIEILNRISGVEFAKARNDAEIVAIDEDLIIPVISLEDLRANKRASGRPKDLGDLDNLPE